MKVFKQYRELAPGQTFDNLKNSLVIGSEFYIKDGDKLKKYTIIPTPGNEDKIGRVYNSKYANIWCTDCTLVTFKVILTFESNADTTVPVYYTKESFVNGIPDETISLKANERKTTTINESEIYRFGVSDYDPTTLNYKNANTAITFAGVQGTVVDGYRLFDRASGLKEIDVSEMDTSNVTDMEAMFNGCSNLATLDVSNWNTSNVTNMQYMFNRCRNLATLDVSNWNTSNVTDMMEMFEGCSSLTTLDLSNWNTSNVTDMEAMFSECSNLATLDVSNWNTSNVTDMSYMFYGCSNLATLDVSNWDVSNVTDMEAMFSECSNLATLDVSNWNTSNVTNMSYMFSGCSNLATLDVSNWNTSNVTDMAAMFKRCSSLTTLDVSNWDVSNVTNMRYMFEECSSLTTLDVSNWNTSNVTNMMEMFERCSSLTTLDLSNWNTSNVTNMMEMFYGCSNLATLDLSNWNTSNVTNMMEMFYDCNNLHLSDFEGFLNKDFLKVSNTEGMFRNCRNIIKNPTDSDYTTSINKIDLSNFSVIGQEMFVNSYLHKWMSIKIGKNIKQISLIGDNDSHGDWMPNFGIDHFEVEDNNLVYISEDKKLLISKDGKMLYDIANNIEGTLVIPEGIEKIRTGCAIDLSGVNMNNIKQQTDLEYDKLPDDYYLKSYKGIDTLDLPSTLILIGSRVMQYTDKSSTDPVLKTIICRAIEPPIVKDNFLSYRGFNNLTLKVPSESIDKYKAANWWKNFKDIQAISE